MVETDLENFLGNSRQVIRIACWSPRARYRYLPYVRAKCRSGMLICLRIQSKYDRVRDDATAGWIAGIRGNCSFGEVTQGDRHVERPIREKSFAMGFMER